MKVIYENDDSQFLIAQGLDQDIATEMKDGLTDVLEELDKVELESKVKVWDWG